MRILKYTLQITDRQRVPLPSAAKILDIQMQGSDLQLWALCDESAPIEARMIEVFGTGHFVPNTRRRYIATVQDGRGLVWHMFEADL